MFKQKQILWAFIALLVTSLASVSQAFEYKETKLGSLPVMALNSVDDYDIWTSDALQEMKSKGFAVEISACRISSNGFHVAAVVPTANKKSGVWLDGKEGEAYDQVRGITRGSYNAREFMFSPDGQRLAYTAKIGGKWFMVIDGKKGAGYDALREPYFSMDGKHVCYMAFRGKDCILVMDGKECAQYPTIKMDSPYFRTKNPARIIDDASCPVAFGPNGHFAFAASKGRDKNGMEREFAVIDGKVGPEYDAVGGIEFSPDGSRWAYIAKKNEKEFVVLDGTPGPKYDAIGGMLTFSPDGRRLAYVATRYNANGDASACVVADGKEGPRFYDVYSASVTFSPDSKRLAYAATPDGDEWLAVEDGKSGPKYDEMGGYSGGMSSVLLLYSPNGELVYRARRGEKYYMVIAGKPSPAYDSIAEPYPVYSSDGKHYAYSVKQGETWYVVRDGVKGNAYSLINHDTLKFTGDNRLVYVADTPDATVIVVNGQAPAKGFYPFFTPDGKHMIRQNFDQDEWMNRKIVFVDGEKTGRFEEVLPMHILPDGTLGFLAVRDESTGDKLAKNLYRVNIKF